MTRQLTQTIDCMHGVFSMRFHKPYSNSRIGRTGRAGRDGTAHTFFQQCDKLRAGELVKVLREAGQEVPRAMNDFDLSIKRKEHKLYGNFGPKDDGRPMKKATKITFD